jgi:NAD/NADP transhydrogenase beta subunit
MDSQPSKQTDHAGKSRNAPAPPLMLQPRSQLSLRALFFLQAEAAAVMLFVVLSLSFKAQPIPIIVATFISVTILFSLIGTALGFYFANPWWQLVGPLVGASVGLLTSILTLSPTENFSKLLVVSLGASSVLIALCSWLSRFQSQEESNPL